MSSCHCHNEYVSKNKIKGASESLNHALQLDHKAISELISVKVNCSKKLLTDHPTLCVQPELDFAGNEVYTVSVLALLNSVLETLEFSKICACYSGYNDSPAALAFFKPLCEVEQ